MPNATLKSIANATNKMGTPFIKVTYINDKGEERYHQVTEAMLEETPKLLTDIQEYKSKTDTRVHLKVVNKGKGPSGFDTWQLVGIEPPKATTPYVGKSGSTSSNKGSNDYNVGMAVGHAFSNATSIAIHNASLTKKEVNLDDVVSLAVRIIDVVQNIKNTTTLNTTATTTTTTSTTTTPVKKSLMPNLDEPLPNGTLHVEPSDDDAEDIG